MISVSVPVLTTERLTLRAQRPDDFEAYAAFYASERSWGMGGPHDRPTAWRGFAAELGHWVIRGYGFWMVDVTATGETIGLVGLWNPEGWSEVEIGWAMYEAAEGKGYAAEAAIAVRTYAYDTLGWGPLSSVIVPDNTRSQALATRLGATPERDWVSPGGTSAVIWRHPGREAVTISGGTDQLPASGGTEARA
ncbi:MAG TPA: GNAT family N-acetyltransferase [Rhodobacteraceae bacterium]|nr:GNAT family N-acetyltransferase [Paracoccaceae bacterium]